MAVPPMLVPPGFVAGVPRRVRARLDGRDVVDTTAARYVWEHTYYPQFVFPAAALAELTLTRSGTEDHRVLGRLDVHDVTVGDRVLPGAARRIGPRGPAGLDGWFRLDFAAFDAWFEEDEAIVQHPRSPYVRVDALPSSRHVRVELDGLVLAESDRPVLLFETGLPTRAYLPSEDVRMDLLTPTDLRTTCPYKGTVSDYWSCTAPDGTLVEDVAWRYDAPFRAVDAIAGHVAFLDEVVDVVLDGERQPRPVALR